MITWVIFCQMIFEFFMLLRQIEVCFDLQKSMFREYRIIRLTLLTFRIIFSCHNTGNYQAFYKNINKIDINEIFRYLPCWFFPLWRFSSAATTPSIINRSMKIRQEQLSTNYSYIYLVYPFDFVRFVQLLQFFQHVVRLH